MSPATKRVYTGHLREFFRWCQENDLMLRNPAASLKTPRARRKQVEIYEADVIRKLLAGQPRLRDRAALMLLFDCGLRKNDEERPVQAP